MTSLTCKDLIRGRIYFYWSKSVYETKASLKSCKLISFNKLKAKVLREDLEVNKIQEVEIKRLIQKIHEPNQMSLGL